MKLDRTIAEVAALLGGRIEGPADLRLAELQSLEDAGPADLSPVFPSRASAAVMTAAATALAATRAGALLAGARATLPDPPAGAPPRSVIRVENAELALDALVSALVPDDELPPPGVHPSAILAEGVSLGADVSVGPHVVIGRGVVIGARTRLLPGVWIGDHAVIGANGVLHPHVVIGSRCRLGDRVTVYAGSVIGKPGFGFRQDKDGRHTRIPQRGIVVLGDDVEIGALCAIDRARFTETRIGNGCKIDNLVMLAHNVQLGEHTALAAQTGIAGSTIVGRRVLMGGQSAIANGLRIGDGVVVGGNSGVMDNLAPGAYVTGYPALPHKAWARDVVLVRRLSELVARVRALEQALAGTRGAEGGGQAS